MNYEDDMYIDHTALDVEWLEQPQLMLKYAQNEADAELEKELAKEKLDLIKSELDGKIREDPDKFGLGNVKITEAVVTATILKHEEYREQVQVFLNAQHAWKTAKGATVAVSGRKDSLENLVKLHGQQYFAGPKMPRNLDEERENKRETANKKIRRIRRNNN